MDEPRRCPLCRGAEAEERAAVAIDAIRRYWRQHRYDLDAEFGELPEVLRAFRCTRCGLGWYEPSMVGGPSLYAALAAWPTYYRKDAWDWSAALDILAEVDAREIVEIGAGAGEFIAKALPRFPMIRGLEFNGTAVAAAQARGLPVANQPIEALRGEPEAIVAFQLLEHLADPGALIASCREKLRHGGLLIVAVPNEDGAMGLIVGDFLNLPPHHATRWQRRTLETAAVLFGFDLVDYRVQPLERLLHRLYRMRHLRPAPSLAGKAMNALRRKAAALTAPLTFARDRKRIGGEAHLAVYRKA
jgi:SAM-dependent methyltransferase